MELNWIYLKYVKYGSSFFSLIYECIIHLGRPSGEVECSEHSNVFFFLFFPEGNRVVRKMKTAQTNWKNCKHAVLSQQYHAMWIILVKVWPKRRRKLDFWSFIPHSSPPASERSPCCISISKLPVLKSCATTLCCSDFTGFNKGIYNKTNMNFFYSFTLIHLNNGLYCQLHHFGITSLLSQAL